MSLNYSHLPNWLEKSKLFRSLFLMRKLYLSKTRFAHFSQFAEDVSIARFFEDQETGFFVDVGCFHPKKYNNTWQLYKKGWRGINVDIDSIKVQGFNVVRPKDINVSCAVSNTEGEMTYHSNGFYSLTNSLDDDFTERKNGYEKKTVQCRRLNNIIDETEYKNRQIDLLSIDVEGHEKETLESLDFDRYNPKLIAVETHHRVFSEIQYSPLYQMLTEKSYSLVGWCGLTLLMANPALQQSLVDYRALVDYRENA